MEVYGGLHCMIQEELDSFQIRAEFVKLYILMQLSYCTPFWFTNAFMLLLAVRIIVQQSLLGTPV